jgi:hypothetical protein
MLIYVMGFRNLNKNWITMEDNEETCTDIIYSTDKKNRYD